MYLITITHYETGQSFTIGIVNQYVFLVSAMVHDRANFEAIYRGTFRRLPGYDKFDLPARLSRSDEYRSLRVWRTNKVSTGLC